MLFWALLASGQITMRRVDGWPTLDRSPTDLDLTSPPDPPHHVPSVPAPPDFHQLRDTTRVSLIARLLSRPGIAIVDFAICSFRLFQSHRRVPMSLSFPLTATGHKVSPDLSGAERPVVDRHKSILPVPRSAVGQLVG